MHILVGYHFLGEVQAMRRTQTAAPSPAGGAREPRAVRPPSGPEETLRRRSWYREWMESEGDVDDFIFYGETETVSSR